MNADTKNMVPYADAFKAWLGQFLEDVLNQKVFNTDMKLGHIITRRVEVRTKIQLI